jgi:hypothetical protein
MPIRFTAGALVIALLCSLSASSAFARARSDSESKSETTEGAAKSNQAATNAKLLSAISSMVEDAKAGKGLPAAPKQIQRQQGNNLSTGQKVAIGVAIATAVVVVVLVVKHKRDHLFGDDRVF